MGPEELAVAGCWWLLQEIGRFAEPLGGGHALRRGGAQYPGAAGVEVWRIQALARRSTSVIPTYLGNARAQALSNVAAEASLQRDLAQLRGDLA
eukprot:1802729-Alexandrium_andersonii.AAC.1